VRRNTCQRLSQWFAHHNTCQWLSERFARCNARRIVHRIAHRFRSLLAILSVYTPQCSLNSGSDRASIPLVASYRNYLHAAILVDSYPVGLRAAILVNGYPKGLGTAILVDAYPNGLRAVILVNSYPNVLRAVTLIESRIGSLTCARRWLSRRFTRHNACRIVHRMV